ncbi:MAG: hypothetical protein K2H64_07285 [Desulfovibrio sp.]|nr:hypothetical protein [Desulfovibrio sp.]
MNRYISPQSDEPGQNRLFPDNLTRVFDQAGRALCLMPYAAVKRQKLIHKSAALLLNDKQGRKILRLNPANEFGFSAFGFIQADECADDAVLRLLPAWATRVLDWRPPIIFPVTEETGFAIPHVYEARCDAPPADSATLILARNEYEALLVRDYAFCPLFKYVAGSGKLPWL